MTNPNDDDVIAESRANSGLVTPAMGGALAHLELVLVHRLGRRSGRAYSTPWRIWPRSVQPRSLPTEGARMRIPEALDYGLAATTPNQVSDPFPAWAVRLRSAT